jgi:O-antigen/teichoic acid export membrane protein
VHISHKLIRELLALGLPLVPAFVMLFVIQHGNKYILQWFSGLNEVGVYNIGFNIGMAMSLLVSALQSAWLPYFMSFADKHDEAGVLFGRILTYYVFIFGSISLLFFIFAKPVIMIMTQPEFYEAYKIVGLSAGASFLSGIFFILLPGIYFAKDVKYVSIIQMIAAVIATGLNFLLIPVFGLLGAGIALMLGFVTMVICIQLWNYRQKNRYIQIAYEWKRIVRFSIIYTFYVTFMLWERHFSLFGELMMSLAATCLLPFFIYALLKSNERMYSQLFCKRLRSGGIYFLSQVHRRYL